MGRKVINQPFLKQMLPQFSTTDHIPLFSTQIPCFSRENERLACQLYRSSPVQLSRCSRAQVLPAPPAQQPPGPALQGCDRCTASELPFHAGRSKSLDLHVKFLLLSCDLFSGKLNLIFKYWFSLNHFKLYLNNSQSPL